MHKLSKEKICWVAAPIFWYWIKSQNTDFIFNKNESSIKICAFCHDEMVKIGEMISLELLAENEKTSLKMAAKEIDPLMSVEKGMKICKTLSLFGYLSNNIREKELASISGLFVN